MEWIPIENGHVVIGLALLWILEGLYPADRNRSRRLRHAAGNLTISLINLVLVTGVIGLLFGHVSTMAESGGWGLLRMLPLSGAGSTVAAILLLDGWMYAWHRANHRIPFLWRFHKVHHSDPEMDVTTATRFHPGEIAISTILRLALMPLLGFSLAQLLLYDALLYPVIQFHHSNVRVPDRLDRILRMLIASPAMHRVHHSPERIETDSNYGSIFSFWDRLAGSFRLKPGAHPEYVFGLHGLEKKQGVAYLLMLPIKSRK